MRQKTITLYTFDELSDEAKANACEAFRNNGFEYHWSDEWKQSLRGFLDAFPVNLKNWSVSTCGQTWFKYAMMNEDDADLTGQALADILPVLGEECPFTGYCGDESFLAPYRAFMLKPDERSYSELMSDCLNSGFNDWESDMEHQESDEYIGDFLQANGYEFEENGNMA